MKSLALAGLMTSINIIIILLSSFQFSYVFSDILLTLFFPLITTLTFLLCEKRTAFCYFIASLTICFFIQFEKTIFYLLPSMLSGFLFALFIKKKWNYIYALISVSLFNALMTALLFFISEKLFSLPVYQAFQTIFRLDEQRAKEVFPLFIAITSMAQTILNAFIIYYELPKYEISVTLDSKPILYLFYCSLLFSALSSIFMYFNAGTAMFFFGISIPSVLFSFYYIIKRKKVVACRFICSFTYFWVCNIFHHFTKLWFFRYFLLDIYYEYFRLDFLSKQRFFLKERIIYCLESFLRVR